MDCITRHLGTQPFKIFAVECLLRSGLGVDGHAEAILYEGVLTSPYLDQEVKKLQRPNSGFIQHTAHEAQ